MEFSRPQSIDTALELLSAGSWQVLSGGTDFYPAHSAKPLDGPILDISALGELRNISETKDAWKIGALTTWTDVINAKLPSSFDGLKLAAREVGSIQIQNRATVVGNLCNASPAADGVPPLLTLDASVELISIRGSRIVALSEFITGNRKTKMVSDEMAAAVVIPKSSARGGSSFLKLGARKYLVISIAMVAARIATNTKGVVQEAAIAVGACSEVARRLPSLEDMIVGSKLDDEVLANISKDHFLDLAPIDDVRATSAYRLEAARELTRRVLNHLVVTS